MRSLVAAAVERAMKVILRALSGALTWLQAADILGIDPRSLRRWRAGYEADQQLGSMIAGNCPPPAKRPWGWCSGFCGCIASSTADSTCGTSMPSSAAITA